MPVQQLGMIEGVQFAALKDALARMALDVELRRRKETPLAVHVVGPADDVESAAWFAEGFNAAWAMLMKAQLPVSQYRTDEETAVEERDSLDRRLLFPNP